MIVRIHDNAGKRLDTFTADSPEDMMSKIETNKHAIAHSKPGFKVRFDDPGGLGGGWMMVGPEDGGEPKL